ncbi:Metallo-beta-lactamase family protein, RNA-specific [Liberibacter crescens BT-1]|uniref:Metallo-beta-lactamase family protein, RNA-specific n=1 Tax=Liberibacter crescens (strain BT-1) TaxID=1215343 RepID=L0ETU3_LIBCB|nr:ribonuclease J [Liberibacter crescens]AGA64265.1 Metallo-beta-lactamase family protein, RNA-specific [Liberibacter crescens BT-1]AMC13313.1 beta-lactamase [Liberibacter crescens]
MKKHKELLFLPLGGLGEIGMNMMLYGYGTPEEREWIMVDCGVSFAGNDFPGVDLIFPDISFLINENQILKAIIITHAHEDHFGAIIDLWSTLDAPVYASPFAIGLLEAKRAYDRIPIDIPITSFKAGDCINIGPFSIEAVQVNHSIPESMALIIKTPLGNILHTGDWKIDDSPILGDVTNKERFCALGDEGVLALMCDSTNAMRENLVFSEKDVEKSLYNIIKSASGRVAITMFSSNVGRICTISKVAKDLGRSVLLLGSSLKRVINVSSDIGLIEDIDSFVPEENFGDFPREKLVVILTGSQGEPRSALAKLARKELRNVALASGDVVVFSSRAIPGNETAINSVKNALIEQGIQIISEDKDTEFPVHVSGHPYRYELQQMYKWTQPKTVVAIHGEASHLSAQKELALKFGVPNVPNVRNGDILRIAPGPVKVIDEVVHGRLFKDGYLIGDLEELGISKRRKLSFVGHLTLNLLLDDLYEIIGLPEIVSVGLPTYDNNGEEVNKFLLKIVFSTIKKIPSLRRRDFEMLRRAISSALRSNIKQFWGKKPLVTVFVNRGVRN